jgi:hypothetical protein
MDEALIQSVAEAIEAADVGYNLRLTKLVDGISEYTLTYSDGEEHVFEIAEDCYRHVRERLLRDKAQAAIDVCRAHCFPEIIEPHEPSSPSQAVGS